MAIGPIADKVRTEQEELDARVGAILRDRYWGRRDLPHPSAATFDSVGPNSGAAVVGPNNTGTLYLAGGVVLLPGFTYNTVTFVSNSTALSVGVNQWFAVVRLGDRAVLGKTADDTSTAWGTFAAKTLTLSAPLTVLEPTPVYLGAVVVATTAPNLTGQNPGGTPAMQGNPTLCGTSTASLTNPASLGATAAALTPVSGRALAWIA